MHRSVLISASVEIAFSPNDRAFRRTECIFECFSLSQPGRVEVVENWELLYFYIIHILANVNLAASDEGRDIKTLGWDELVAQKRKISSDLKSITERIFDIDRNQYHMLATEIREHRSTLDAISGRMRQIQEDVEKNNASLLAVSEKLSQSKNFLSIMEGRLPSESEELLQKLIQDGQAALEANTFKSDRERNDMQTRLKEEAMKLEAIKAVRTIRDQFATLNQESAQINNHAIELETERDSSRLKMTEINSMLDRLYERKRMLGAERESSLVEYDRAAREFELINTRLDAMAEMRKKQREEYGHGLPSDALFKVKETARKKLESGGKLSFEELKLLYGENE